MYELGLSKNGITCSSVCVWVFIDFVLHTSVNSFSHLRITLFVLIALSKCFFCIYVLFCDVFCINTNKIMFKPLESLIEFVSFIYSFICNCLSITFSCLFLSSNHLN